MGLLNCKCCGVRAEPNSDFCYICLGRGHDEDWDAEMQHEQGSGMATTDSSQEQPIKSAQSNKADTKDIDEILHKLTAEAIVRSHGKQPITGPLGAKQEAKALIADVLENFDELDKLLTADKEPKA